VSTESADRQYRASDVLRDPAFLLDAALAPVLFVGANALLGLVPAAVVAVAFAATMVTWRLLRHERVANALLGLIGVAIAVSVAIATGSPEGFFWPRVVTSAGWALALVGTVMARRPAIAFLAHTLYRLPWSWLTHDRVRPAYSEVTLGWAAWSAVRAVVYGFLILAGEAALLAGLSLALAWVPFVLVWASYRYVAWRLVGLNAPGLDEVEPAAEGVWAGRSDPPAVSRG
jgi:hypothetical protein